MNSAQLRSLDQRLDQHADATETILKRLDEIIANHDTNVRTIRTLTVRVAYIEGIILPDDHPRRS